MSTTAEIIRKAADHIEQVGLHKGNMFKGGVMRDDVPCCTLGAFAIVTGEPFGEAGLEAEVAVVEALGLKPTEPGEFAHRPLPAWNDRPSQRKGKLVAALRRAADKVEAS